MDCISCMVSITGSPTSKAIGVCTVCRTKAGWKDCFTCNHLSVIDAYGCCHGCKVAPVKQAYNDTEEMPANRLDVLCMNCNRDCYEHYGWQCNGIGRGNRSANKPTERYLTPDMKDDRVNGTPTLRSIKVADEKAISNEWKAFRDNGIGKGECVCRIQASDCRYHRPEGDNVQPRTGWSFFGAKQ
jgi:hypothetical protein